MSATLVSANELARCFSISEKFRALFGSSPALTNQKPSELDFGSPAYMDMIENLCYFSSHLSG
jgi:hypothetical protein